MIPDLNDVPSYLQRRGNKKPEHEVIDMSRVSVDMSDTRPHWEQAEPSEGTEKSRAYSVTRSNEPAEEPHYLDPRYGQRDEMAEKIGQAVASAIRAGDLDVNDFLPFVTK